MNPNPCAKCKVVEVEDPSLCDDPTGERLHQGEHKHFRTVIQFCPLHAAAEEMVRQLTLAATLLRLQRENVQADAMAAVVAKAEGK